LEEMGLFKSQVEKIVEYSIPKMEKELKKNNMDYQITWDRPASEYPEFFIGMLFSQMKKYIVEWSEANIPQAWWIPMFK
jgi:hypothetical protein